MKTSLSKKLFSDNFIGKLSIWHLTIMLFAFPVTQSIPALLGVASTNMNIVLKFLYLCMAIYLIVVCVAKRKTISMPLGGWLIIVFWIIYSTRLIYDTQFAGIKFESFSNFKFYTITFGSCLTSTLAVVFSSKFLDLKKLNLYFYFTIYLSNLAILLVVVLLFGSINPLVLSGRLSFAFISNSGADIDILNPITISFYGELLALLSITNLMFKNELSRYKLLNILGVFIGLLALLLGASRGPLLGFLAIFFFIIVSYFYIRKKTSMFWIRAVSSPLIFFFVVYYLVVNFIDYEKLTIFKRVTDFMIGGYSSSLDNRDEKFLSAWNQFLEHPIIGDRFLDHLNSYPHNVVLESLMAVGIVGSIFLIFLLLHSLYLCLVNVLNKKDYLNITIILLANLIIALTSSSLFGSYEFWIVIALYTCFPKKIQSLNG